MMWYWGGGMHWWGWLLGSIGMVVFWGLIIWAIWYLVARVARRPYDSRYPYEGRQPFEGRQPYEGRQGPVDAKAILDERLARGEISAEEYQRLLAVMRGGGSTGGDGRPPVGASGQR